MREDFFVALYENSAYTTVKQSYSLRKGKPWTFGEILSKTWKITWKYKILWVFGILSSCSENVTNIKSLRDNDRLVDLIPQAKTFFQQVEVFFDNLEGSARVLFFIGLLVFIVVLVIIAYIGAIGLIYGTIKADEIKENSENLTFREIWHGSKPYFWRVLKLGLLIGAINIAIGLLFGIYLLIVNASSAGVILFCVVPLICVMIPVFWALSILSQQAMIAVMSEDLGTFASLRRAWHIVIKENLGNYILLSLIVGIGSLIISFVIHIPTFLTFISIVFGASAGSKITLTTGLITILVLLALYLVLIATPLTGILTVYTWGIWTLAFQRCASISLADLEEVEIKPELAGGETPDTVD